MRIRAILFDLDDTLHDKAASTQLIADRQYDDARLVASGVNRAQWIAEYVELNDRKIEKTEVFARLATMFDLPAATASGLLADFDANFGKFARPFDGARDLLAACRERGLKLGIVTNGRDGFQRSKITGLELDGYVDAIVTSGAFGAKKPDPRIFLECLSALDVAADAAAFVGDDFDADIEPALGLGMHAVWKSVETSARVPFCSNSLLEIQTYLLRRVSVGP